MPKPYDTRATVLSVISDAWSFLVIANVSCVCLQWRHVLIQHYLQTCISLDDRQITSSASAATAWEGRCISDVLMANGSTSIPSSVVVAKRVRYLHNSRFFLSKILQEAQLLLLSRSRNSGANVVLIYTNSATSSCSP